MNFPKLNIKSRLLLMMLLLSTVVCVVLCVIADSTTQTALRSRVVDQLTSVRDSRSTQIETYFKNMRSHVASLSQDPTVVNATKQFVDSLNNPDQPLKLMLPRRIC